MSRLTRDGTAEPVSRDQILRHAQGQGNIHLIPCSADHEQVWQPYPVDPYYVMTTHTIHACNLINIHTYILHIESSLDRLINSVDRSYFGSKLRQSRLRVIFNTYTPVRAAEGGQRNEVRSRSNLDLAPSLGAPLLNRRSTSRQSSLPKNRYCQKTATNYLLYQSMNRAYTEGAPELSLRFTSISLLKRFMKARQLHQCMVSRALFGGVENTSKLVYSSDSQLLFCCPDPRKKTSTRVYCFQHVAPVFVLLLVRSRWCVFFLFAVESVRTTEST